MRLFRMSWIKMKMIGNVVFNRFVIVWIPVQMLKRNRISFWTMLVMR